MLNDEQVKWLIQRLRREGREAISQAYFNGALCTGGVPLGIEGARKVIADGEQWAAYYCDLSPKRLDEVVAQYKMASSDPDSRLRCNPLDTRENV